MFSFVMVLSIGLKIVPLSCGEMSFMPVSAVGPDPCWSPRITVSAWSFLVCPVTMFSPCAKRAL